MTLRKGYARDVKTSKLMYMKKPATNKLRNDITDLAFAECDPFRSLQIAENRLVFIRDIVELRHLYANNEARLIRYLTEVMRIENLRAIDIIDFDHYATILETNKISLGATEMELSCFVYNGFTAHELRLLYGHGNPESIYVRMNRIRAKINKQLAQAANAEEEKVEVLTF
jgi:hypothetical protein